MYHLDEQSLLSLTRGLHTAPYHPQKIQVYYPYHPRYGKFVYTIGKKSHQGQEHFIIKQPDGSLALLPSWMCSKEAENTKLANKPQISITALQDLNKLITCDLLVSKGKNSPEIDLSGEHNAEIKRAKGNRKNTNSKRNRKHLNKTHSKGVNRVVRKPIT